MTTLREWIVRFWGTLWRHRRDHDLEEELKLHLEFAAEDLRGRSGASEDAQRTARIRAGGTSQAMEILRDQRGIPLLDDLVRDVRHALRSLMRSPVFTAVALVTLALGIGANTAIFSIVNAVVLQPLSYPKPSQLMHLSTQYPGVLGFRVSWPEYSEFRAMNRSFSSVGAYQERAADLVGGDRPRRVRIGAVDKSLLDALGIQPAQGRLFTPEETETAMPTAFAILSHELWASAFGSRPVVGEMVDVEGLRRQIIGIMPPGAALMDQRTEIWLPLGLGAASRQQRGSHNLYLIGRLRDAVTLESAQRELDSLIETWSERTGVKDHVFAPLTGGRGHVLHMNPLQQQIVGDAGRAIWMLQAAVGLVLLIASANLANLLLARSETRRNEFAIRTALGASRSRLLRQFMTEGIVLSIAGGILGVGVARGILEALLLAYPTTLPRAREVSVDAFALLFTLAVSTATGLLFGLAPIIQTRAQRPLTTLAEGGSKGAVGNTRQVVRRLLVIGEVALAVMVVIGAGLLLRTLLNLTKVDVGFKTSHLVTFSIGFSGGRYEEGSVRMQAWQRLLDKVRAIPGIESATAMRGLPPNRPSNSNNTDIESYTRPPDGPPEVVNYDQSVMSNYFETMGIPIVAGRGFAATDGSSAGRVVVVNETFVKTFLRGLNPIGQRLRRSGWYDSAWWTIIGVARDVKQGGVDQPVGTELYFFAEQFEENGPLVAPYVANVTLRTTLPVATVGQTLERVVREVDPVVPIVRLREMDEVLAESISRPRLLAQLVGAFAGLALLLAAIGTYGVLAYTVAERRREIGICMALGAERFRVLTQIMKQGLAVASAGIVIGLAGALALTRLMKSLLFGVEPTDIPTLASVAVMITLVSAVACWLPAWRASRLDPNVMLRDE